MGLLATIFRRGSGAKPAVPTMETRSQDCAHLALTPRWDNLADMGKAELATRFVCDSCHSAFTPAEAERVRSEAASRVRPDVV